MIGFAIAVAGCVGWFAFIGALALVLSKDAIFTWLESRIDALFKMNGEA